MGHEVVRKADWRDVDAMHHVNNAVYFSWMETVRTEYFVRLRDGIPLDEFDFIVAHAGCDYRRGVRFGEEVRVNVWPSRIGTTSFEFSYEMTVGTETVAVGRTVQVCFDYAKQQKKPIDDELRKRLASDLASAPAETS